MADLNEGLTNYDTSYGPLLNLLSLSILHFVNFEKTGELLLTVPGHTMRRIVQHERPLTAVPEPFLSLPAAIPVFR